MNLEACLAKARQIRERTGRGPKPKHDWESAIRLWFEVRNGHEVARRLGIRQATVTRILNAVGIRVGKGSRKPVHVLPLPEVASRYRAGESTTDLGRSYGVDPEVIRRRLIRFGQRMRQRGQFEKKGTANYQWKGGRDTTDREPHKLARRLAEFCLQRTLHRGEVIHHQDEDPRNNDLANLWLFPSIAAHLRYHQRQLASQCPIGSAEAILMVLENGGRPLPLPADPTPWSDGISRLYPYDTRVLVENALKELGILQGPQVRPRARRQSA